MYISYIGYKISIIGGHNFIFNSQLNLKEPSFGEKCILAQRMLMGKNITPLMCTPSPEYQQKLLPSLPSPPKGSHHSHAANRRDFPC